MAGFRSITPSINVNTASGALRTELQNTFARLDGQLQQAPYRLSTQNGPVGNTGSGETTLMTFQLNFNTLSNIGQSLLIFAAGKTNSNANNKTFKLKLGSTTLFTSGALALNNVNWSFQGEIVCNGAANQIFWGQFNRSGGSPVITTTTATEDFGTNLDIAFTGQGTASDDISLYYYKTTLIN